MHRLSLGYTRHSILLDCITHVHITHLKIRLMFKKKNTEITDYTKILGVKNTLGL